MDLLVVVYTTSNYIFGSWDGKWIQVGQTTIVVHCTGNVCHLLNIYTFSLGRLDPIPDHGLPIRGFAITLIHTTLARTPLDEWSARRSGLYLTVPNIHKRQTSMRPAEFESTTSASE